MVYQVINYWTEGAKAPPDDASSQGPSDATSGATDQSNEFLNELEDTLGFSPVFLLVVGAIVALGFVVIKKIK